MAARIATVHGQLLLQVADAEPISLGTIEIPITAFPSTDSNTGALILQAKPNMREVREFVESVFGRGSTPTEAHKSEGAN